jgi:hypothetical protein
MPKKCAKEGCGNYVFSKGYCKFHQYLAGNVYTIPKVSKKQKEALKKYSGLRVEFLRERRLCEAKLPGCARRSTDVHHLAGRGKFLLIVSTWMAICRPCHRTIHDEMSAEEAYERGFKM